MNYHRDLVPALTKKARDTVTKYLSVPKLAERDFSFCCVTPALFSVMESITFDDEHDCIVTTDCIYHSLVDTLEYVRASEHKEDARLRPQRVAGGVGEGAKKSCCFGAHRLALLGSLAQR
jgi:hypothetical protein